MSGKNFRFQDNVLYLFQPAGHVSCTSYHGCEPLWLILGLTLTVQPNGKYPYWPSRWTAVWSLGPNPVWIEREFARFEFLRKKRISKSFFFFFYFCYLWSTYWYSENNVNVSPLASIWMKKRKKMLTKLSVSLTDDIKNIARQLEFSPEIGG